MSFFFQAEDGIRDVAVTGVQTCALPIYGGSQRLCTARLVRSRSLGAGQTSRAGSFALPGNSGSLKLSPGRAWRSEEGRGGEEGRSRGAADHLKKKKRVSRSRRAFCT